MNTVTLVLSVQTYNTIIQGLQELPWKIANPALAEIDPQMRAALATEKSGGQESRTSQSEEG
jgi:hypothetical protein